MTPCSSQDLCGSHSHRNQQVPHPSCLKKHVSQTPEAVVPHPCPGALNAPRASLPDYTSLPKPSSCLPAPSSGSSLDFFLIENEEVDEFLSSSPAGGVSRVMRASGPPSSIGLLTHQQTRYAVDSEEEEEGRRKRDGMSLSSSSSVSSKRVASQEEQKTQEDNEEEKGTVDKDGNSHEEEHHLGERSLSFFLDLPEKDNKFPPYKRFFSSEEKRGSRSTSQYSFFPLYQACVGGEESLGDSAGGGRVGGIDDFEVSIVGDPLFEERRPRAEDISGNIMKFRRHTTQRPSLVFTRNTATTAASC